MDKKPKLPRIPRTSLNERMKQLPSPVREHCQRTKRFASFILERVASEEWFIETGYNPESLAAAVFYHDIGKLNLVPDDMYLTGRTNAEKRARYYAHTDEGINVIQQELGASLEAYREKSFGGILRRVVTEHHMPFTECGVTDEFGERQYALPGRLAAVADCFDNLLFVGKGADGDLDEAVAAIKERSGKELDSVLVDALVSDMTALEAFAGTLASSWIYKRKQDRYGIGFTFRPAETGSGEAVCLIAEPFLNDIYYGRVKTAAFMSVAEESDTVFTLESLCLEHLANLMRSIQSTGTKAPSMLYTISARELEHPTFLRRISSMLERYGVDRDQIIIALKDSDITGFQVDAAKFRGEVHSEGMKFAVTGLGEGNSVLTTLGSIDPDMAILAGTLPQRLTSAVRIGLEECGIQVLTAGSAPFEEYDLPFRLLEVMCNETA